MDPTPRLPLTGADRERILQVIHDGISTRPKIPANWRPEPGGEQANAVCGVNWGRDSFSVQSPGVSSPSCAKKNPDPI